MSIPVSELFIVLCLCVTTLRQIFNSDLKEYDIYYGCSVKHASVITTQPGSMTGNFDFRSLVIVLQPLLTVNYGYVSVHFWLISWICLDTTKPGSLAGYFLFIFNSKHALTTCNCEPSLYFVYLWLFSRIRSATTEMEKRCFCFRMTA